MSSSTPRATGAGGRPSTSSDVLVSTPASGLAGQRGPVTSADSPSTPGTALPTIAPRQHVEPARHPKTPKDLPASDGDLGVPLHNLDKLMQCYGTLRSFGFILRLSPFSLMELCRDMAAQRVTPLVDEIHSTILALLQLSPPVSDKDEDDMVCLVAHWDGQQNYQITEPLNELVKDTHYWRFLDTVTWPEYLAKYLTARNQFVFADIDVPDYLTSGEHFSLSLDVKVDILHFLCEDLLDSPMVRSDVSIRSDLHFACIEQERDEVKDKKAVDKKQASGETKTDPLPMMYDHLQCRDGLDALEIEVCDLTGVGGNLVCCDGCPASYLAKSVGLKRFGNENEKWFCEECRIGGRTRSYRLVHRDSPAVIWAALPSLASFGTLPDDTTIFAAYGRLFVGRGADLYAYYSDVGKIEELIGVLSKRPPPKKEKETPKPKAKNSPAPKKSSSKKKAATPKSVSTPREEEVKSERGANKRQTRKPQTLTYADKDSDDDEWDFDDDEEEEEEEKPKRKRASAKKGKKKMFDDDDDEWDPYEDSSFQAVEEDYDPLSALKLKRKAIADEFRFRGAVESKAEGREYSNKYAGAYTIPEVQEMLQIEKKTTNIGRPKKNEAVMPLAGGGRVKRWEAWPRLQLESQSESSKNGLLPVASFLVQFERAMQGLVDGAWLKRDGRRNWGQLAKGATEVSELVSAALELESSLRAGSMLPSWESSGPPRKKRHRPGRVKGQKMVPKDKGREVDWKEVAKIDGFAEVAAYAEDDNDDDEEAIAGMAFAGGKRATWYDLKLSKTAVRAIMLAGGQVEYGNFVYNGENGNFDHMMPTNKLTWVCGLLNAKTVAQLAIQMRTFHEFINWEAINRPEVTRKMDLTVPIPEKAVDKRLVAGREGMYEYAVRMYGDAVTMHWMHEDKVPLYCIKDFENEARKAAKLHWWLDFEWYPGVGVEVQFDGEWYQAYVVQAVDRIPAKPVEGMPLHEFKEGVGMVRVHYIGGREEEDEWLSKDSAILREDRRCNERAVQDMKRARMNEKKVAMIKDKDERMALRLELYAQRKRQREEEQKSVKDRLKEKEEEKERREQLRSERVRLKEQELEERRKEREEKIRLRKEEADKRKEDQKLVKKLAQEKQRILQGKSSWWRDFPWGQGVMVEMDWEGDYFDCTVIKLIGPDPNKPQFAIEGEKEEKVKSQLEVQEVEEQEKRLSGLSDAAAAAAPSQQDQGGTSSGAEQVSSKGQDGVGSDRVESGGGDHEMKDVGGETDAGGEGDSKMAVDGGAESSEAPAEGGADASAPEQGKVQGTPMMKSPSKKKAVPHMEEMEVAAWLPYLTARCEGPKIIYPKNWPEDSVFVCEEDDRPIDVARKFRVNLERLVRLNKKAYPTLTKLSALKQGTLLRLPLPLDVQVASKPPPPADPMNVGVLLVHYVGGTETETEWVFRCCKQMKPSSDKLWNAVSAEANDEMNQLLAPDPDAWKKHCKKVLKRVKKHDKAWPFWEPIDPIRDGVEDYFDVIKQPMCLDRIEEKIDKDEYKVPEEFTADIKLTFNNAIVYNPSDNSFHQMAKDLLKYFEEIFAVGNASNNWNQPYTSVAPSSVVSDKLKGDKSVLYGGGSTKKKAPAAGAGGTPAGKDKDKDKDKDKGEGGEGEKPKKPLTTAEIKLNMEGKDAIRQAIAKMMKMPCAADFLEPVSLKQAPDYLDVIKKPMDLGTVQEMAEKNRFLMLKSFKQTVQLVVDNAMQYNNEEEEVCKNAKKLEKALEKIAVELEAKIVKIEATRDYEAEKAGAKTDGTPSSSKQTPKPPKTPADKVEAPKVASSVKKKAANPEPEGGWDAACLSLLKKLLKHKDAWPFTEPVDAKALKLKDYHKVIKKPMDLGTIKKRLDEGEYAKTFMTDFPADCRLVFTNAVTYNDEEDPIHQMAVRMKGLFDESWAKILEEVLLSSMAQPASASKPPKAEESRKSIGGTASAPDAPKAPSQLSEPEGGWDAPCLALVKKLLKHKDAWPFKEPVDAKALKLKDYHTVIKRPMDLGTVKSKVEGGEYSKSKFGTQFPADCRLVFNNAKKYNDKEDPIYEHAVTLLAVFEEAWSKIIESAKEKPAAAAHATPKSAGKKEVKDEGKKDSKEADKREGKKEAAAVDASASKTGSKPKKQASHKDREEEVELEEIEDAAPKAPPKKKDWRPPCAKLLTKLITERDGVFFLEPVDPKALKLRDYFKIVKNPMDFDTIDKRMKSEAYQSPDEFERDVRLTLDNAILYNQSAENPVHQAASRLKALFEDRWEKLGLIGEVRNEAPKSQAGSGKKSAAAGAPASSSGKKAKGAAAAAQEEEEEEEEFVPFEPGTQVRMIFDDGKWYKGVIEKYYPSKDNYRITFPDGDSQVSKVPGKDCELVGKPKKAATPAGGGKDKGAAKQETGASSSKKVPEAAAAKEAPGSSAASAKRKGAILHEEEDVGSNKKGRKPVGGDHKAEDKGGKSQVTSAVKQVQDKKEAKSGGKVIGKAGAEEESGEGKAATGSKRKEEKDGETGRRNEKSGGGKDTASSSAGGAGKRKSGGGDADLGLHEDPELNLGRRVSVKEKGVAKEGFIIRYQSRSGKYRVLFEDGVESDYALPDKNITLLPVDPSSPPSKRGKR